MNPKIKLNTKQARPIVKAVFPDYKGRTFFLEFTDQVTFWDTNWGGGTRNYYAFVNADGRTGHLSVPAPWVNMAEGQTVEMQPDVLVVKHTYFCGRDLGITIYAHPVHAPRYIPEEV